MFKNTCIHKCIDKYTYVLNNLKEITSGNK